MHRAFCITLEAARVNARLSLSEAAALIGIEPGLLREWETNPADITDEYGYLIKMEEVYGISMDFVDFS